MVRSGQLRFSQLFIIKLNNKKLDQSAFYYHNAIAILHNGCNEILPLPW